jgi:hypothetical protein
MAKFRTSASKEQNPQSIVLMFRDLNRAPSVKYLYSHQDRVLEKYCQDHLKSKDLAIELPTGTGKTLVGLLIAEYRRRISKERIVFLCPTRQLCCQVEEQAQRYGIQTALLIGPQSAYDTALFSQYQQGNKIAITTYSGVFNTNPRINDPEVVICDDAHAADNYISALWTISIERNKHKQLYEAICRTLQSAIPEYVAHHIELNKNNKLSENRVDLVSTIAFHPYIVQLREVLSEFLSQDKDLKYSWSILASNLECCSIYVSSRKIEIRPLIPPTASHKPFSSAKQRIYMSATLGEDGDIERMFGVKKIDRLPIPEEWNKRSTGRRLILFPSQSSDLEPVNTAVTILKTVNRSLILTPDTESLQKWEDHLKTPHTIFKSEDIEQNLDRFRECSNQSSLLLAGRYDGIDLPGDDCRFMILDGEPSASGLQELYIRTRLGISSQLNNRIRTRITQAMGRCTRDESDYSVVIILGEKLVKRFCTRTFTQGIHPELQAEIAFGLDNSTDNQAEDFVDLVQAFLSRSSDWHDAEKDIRKRRDESEKILDSTTQALATAMPYEIDYMYALWSKRYEEALKSANKVLESLAGGSDLQPYRAFWYHQAATVSFLAWKNSENEAFKTTTISLLDKAASTCPIEWLDKLKSQVSEKSEVKSYEVLPTREAFIEVEALLGDWGISGQKFAKQLRIFKEKIESKKYNLFENGLAILGKMLGAKTYQWGNDEKGTPDGLWIFGDWCSFVFEAKTQEQTGSGISLDTVTQAGRHEVRVRSDKLIPTSVPCFTIVISPRNTIDKITIPHLNDMCYVSHDEIISLFSSAEKALERLRTSAPLNTEETLQSNFSQFYSERSVDLRNIKDMLLKTKLKELPIH